MQDALFPGTDVVEQCSGSQPKNEAEARFREPDRSQTVMQTFCLDRELAEDHRARIIWAVVEQLDLSMFCQWVKARGSAPGRPTTHPKLLVSLLLLAHTHGIGSGREIARRCEEHIAYRWLCGGVSVCYRTITDFRVEHGEALDHLLTQVLARLTQRGLVNVRRVTQDGVRIRAAAGGGSYKRRQSVEEQIVEMQAHVAALKRQMDGAAMTKQHAAKARALREKQERLQQVMAELPAIEAARAARKRQPTEEARVSTTDPQARIMRMGNGGYRPAYNVQIAADTESRAIVGVEVTNAGTDHDQATPMREQVEQRSGGKVEEHLADGGYVTLKTIDEAAKSGTKVYAPPPKPKKAETPYTPRQTDSGPVAEWRQRMGTQEAKDIYKLRASTSETINGDLKQHRGVRQFNVRGINKARCVVLWAALAYNLMHFGHLLAAT